MVGVPILVDETNTAVMHHPRCIDNMDMIDGINRAILQSTAMIGEAIRARGGAAVAAGGTGEVAAANCKLELLLKQHKLARSPTASG